MPINWDRYSFFLAETHGILKFTKNKGFFTDLCKAIASASFSSIRLCGISRHSITFTSGKIRMIRSTNCRRSGVKYCPLSGRFEKPPYNQDELCRSPLVVIALEVLHRINQLGLVCFFMFLILPNYLSELPFL